jgi:hypothetical protein
MSFSSLPAGGLGGLAPGTTVTTRKSRIVTSGGAPPLIGGTVVNAAPILNTAPFAAPMISSPSIMTSSFASPAFVSGGVRSGSPPIIGGPSIGGPIGVSSFGGSGFGGPVQCPHTPRHPPACTVSRGIGGSVVGGGAMTSSLVRSVSPPQGAIINTNVTSFRPSSPIGGSIGVGVGGSTIGGAALGGAALGGAIGGVGMTSSQINTSSITPVGAGAISTFGANQQLQQQFQQQQFQ